MGLLSDPKKRAKIVEAISKYNNSLCALAYVVGVVWFLALAYQPVNNKTYFSENALLPGVVESGFFFDFSAESYLTELKEILANDTRQVPRDWVFNKFREIGLDTYLQNYSIKYPLNIARGQVVPGQNVYGILRARRAARTEAIVLSTPFRPKSSDLPQTIGGIVMMIGLAKYFRRQPYWSKDIVFLVSDHEQIGMQAWLDGYHQVDAQYILPGEMGGRSGPIQAAINLEIPEGNIKYFNVKMEGLNGQLPNLDLVNLVVRLCKKHNIGVGLHHRKDLYEYQAETITGFQYTLGTMLRMMWTQATGVPSGNHGLFHRYHIEAVTLEGVRRKKTGKIGIETTGRVVEGICRSLNNLLERFHQSFFFYILPATERYASIGLYMIPFAIMCLPCLIKQAISLWVSRSVSRLPVSDQNGAGTQREAGADQSEADGELQDQKEAEGESQHETEPAVNKGDSIGESVEAKTTEKLNAEELDRLENEHEDEGDDIELEERPSGVMTVLPIMFSSVLMALLCYTAPELLADMSGSMKMNIEDGIFYGVLALFTASLLFPRMVARKTSDDKKLSFDWVLLKSVTLIFQSLVLFSLSLMNISLAFFLGAVTIPVSLMVHPTENRLISWLQKFLLLLISPLVLLYVAAVLSSLGEKHGNYYQLLINSWNALSRGLFLSMMDRYFFGSWMFSLFSFAVLPNWLTLWGISFCEPV